MKDYLGQELVVGDVVIFHSLDYREFRTSRVEKITDCFVFLTNTENKWRQAQGKPLKQRGHQLIKHPNQSILDK